MAKNRSKIGQNVDGAKGTIHDPLIFGTRFGDNQPFRLKFPWFLKMECFKKSISVQGGPKKRSIFEIFNFFHQNLFFSHFFSFSRYLRRFFLCFQNRFYLNNAHQRHQIEYQNRSFFDTTILGVQDIAWRDNSRVQEILNSLYQESQKWTKICFILARMEMGHRTRIGWICEVVHMCTSTKYLRKTIWIQNMMALVHIILVSFINPQWILKYWFNF